MAGISKFAGFDWAVCRLSLVAMGLCSTAQAQAQIPAVQLSWQAPAQCPTSAEVRAALDRVLGPSARSTASKPEPLRASATIETSGAGYSMHLVTEYQGQRGERTLEAVQCSALMRTVTLLVAVMLGREHVTTTNATAVPPQPPTPTTSVKPGHASSASPPAPPHATDNPSPELLIWVGAGAHLSHLPNPGFVGTFGAELHLNKISIELQASAWPAFATQATQDMHARLVGSALGLNACRAVPIGPVDVGLCGGGQLALLWARAWGPRIQPGQAFAPWVAVRLATHMTWPRKSAVRLRLMAGTAISLQRPALSSKARENCTVFPHWPRTSCSFWFCKPGLAFGLRRKLFDSARPRPPPLPCPTRPAH